MTFNLLLEKRGDILEFYGVAILVWSITDVAVDISANESLIVAEFIDTNLLDFVSASAGHFWGL